MIQLVLLHHGSGKPMEYGRWVASGSSGGGSVNIFYDSSFLYTGTFNVRGGVSVSNGGTGGSGTVTKGIILDGMFLKE